MEVVLLSHPGGSCFVKSKIRRGGGGGGGRGSCSGLAGAARGFSGVARGGVARGGVGHNLGSRLCVRSGDGSVDGLRNLSSSRSDLASNSSDLLCEGGLVGSKLLWAVHSGDGGIHGARSGSWSGKTAVSRFLDDEREEHISIAPGGVQINRSLGFSNSVVVSWTSSESSLFISVVGDHFNGLEHAQNRGGLETEESIGRVAGVEGVGLEADRLSDLIR